MLKNAFLPVRLDADTNERLDVLSKKLHLSKSAIIRMLAEAFLKYAEEQDGKLVMPPTFERYEVHLRE
jgi:predicted DNA-binding protein